MRLPKLDVGTDLLIGAFRANPRGLPDAGSTFLVFWRRGDLIFEHGFEQGGAD